MVKKYELIFEVDLKIDLEDGSYDTCIEEFDFNLDPAVIEKLINEQRFDPDVWYSHTFEGDNAKVIVKNSEIDEASFRFSVNELLDQCGWFESYSIAVVDKIWQTGGYIQISVYG